jgi:hypothetical protein
MWHSCGRFSLDDLFARSEPHVLPLFRKFERMVRACGPVRMIPQKTRVVFQARVRFAGAYPRKDHALCSIALARRVRAPRFVKHERYAGHFQGHFFRLASESDLDAALARWLRESYAVGEQRYLRARDPNKRRARR